MANTKALGKMGAIAFAFMMASSLSGKAPPNPVSEIGIVEVQPQAQHRLVIISSLSCPHCRAFDMQKLPDLRKKAKAARMTIQIVPYLLFPQDLASTMMIACGPQSNAIRRMTILFRAQPELQGNLNQAIASGSKTINRERLNPMQIAELSNLFGQAQALELTKAQMKTCLADEGLKAKVKMWSDLADRKWSVQGTPTFILDGKTVNLSQLP